MRPLNGWRNSSVGSVLYAGLIALVLVSGADDTLILTLGGVVAGSVDPDEPPPTEVEDYCRIRRDAATEILSVALASVGLLETLCGGDADLRRQSARFDAQTPSPSPMPEHWPRLVRRSRAPGTPLLSLSV